MKRKLILSCTMTLLASAIVASLSPVYASSETGAFGASSAKAPDTANPHTDADHARNQNSKLVGPESASSTPAAQEDSKSESTKAQSKKKSVTDLTGITVSGQLSALRQEAETKRDAIGVVDSISAEEAGKFPDQNVADALQRVPGVSVNRGGGEANQISVRGFGPSFVNVLLNGRPLASASSDRSFNFDALPSEIIQNAVVHKTGEADLPAGGIGGTVNIITAQPSDFKGFHATATVAGVNDHIGGGLASKTTPKVSGMIGDSNSSGTFGWLASVLYYKRDHQEQSVDDEGWITGLDYTNINPAYDNVAIAQTLEHGVTRSTSTRKALNGAVDWFPTDNLKVSLNTFLSRYDVESKYSAFGSYSNTNDIKSITADKNGTALRYTRFDTGLLANDYIQSSNPSRETDEQTGAHVTYNFNNSTEIDWDSSISKAWVRGAPDSYFTVIGTRAYGVNPVWTNNGPGQLPSYSNLPSTTNTSDLHAHVAQYGQDELNVSSNILENRIHLSKSFLNGMLSKIDFGVEDLRQTKEQQGYITPNTFACLEYCGYTANVPASAVGAHVANYGSLVGGVSPGAPTSWVAYDPTKLFAYLASPAAYNQRPDPAAFKAMLAANGGGFAAQPDLSTYSKIRERIKAAYVKANLQGTLGEMPWTLGLGLRYTRTETTSSAYSVPVLSIYVNPHDTSNAIPTYGQESPISAKGSYGNWLPSLNFKLNLRDNMIFRVALSKTLTRPDLGDLSSAKSYNFLPQSQRIYEGNPNLKPFVSKNADVGLEYYFSDTNYASLDGFYKKVSNFVTSITTQKNFLGFPFLATRPVNLNTATVKGAEATFNYQLADMDGFLGYFNGIGVAANYTYVTSNASLSPTQIQNGAEFAVPGIGNSYNFSGYYNRGPVELRLAYNWRAKYLAAIADANEGNPLTVQSYGQLDFSGSYKLSKHVSLSLSVTNLTDEKIRNYEVYVNRMSRAEADGRRVILGVRASF